MTFFLKNKVSSNPIGGIYARKIKDSRTLLEFTLTLLVTGKAMIMAKAKEEYGANPGEAEELRL